MSDTQRRIDELTEKIRDVLKAEKKYLREGKDEIHRMNEFYWENYTEMDEYGYENYDNQQQLFRQADANRDQKMTIYRLERLQDSPFFGGLLFLDDDDDEEDLEMMYIGIGNFSERPGSLPLIYDWRAPISSMFYDFDSGRASYQAPCGEVTGEIRKKYQYKIKKGKLVYEFENDTKIDDEILKQELGKHGDVKMKNIIRTIQKEQNSIIRNREDDILIIQGAAGSGKTSIALHRIAYLLYHDRDTLKSSQVLVLSPNNVFTDYISQILPELGEDNIRQMTFDVFAYRELQNIVKDTEDRCQQMERMIRMEGTKEGERAKAAYRYKQSETFVGDMEMFLLDLEDRLMDIHDFTYTIKVGREFEKKKTYTLTMKTQEILDLFYKKLSEYPLLTRMETVAERFIEEFELMFLSQQERKYSYEEEEELRYDMSISAALQQELDDRMDQEREEGQCLTKEDRQNIRNGFGAMYRTTSFFEIYNWFLEDLALPELSEEAKELLPYEDVHPLMYMKYRLIKRQPHRVIRHLVVDEMQDYSYLQYKILTLLFNCKMTILGDRAQSLEDGQREVLDFLPKLLGRKCRVLQMNRSYRNTLEIAEYAGSICPVEGIEYFERHGKPVCIIEEKDPEVICRELREQLSQLPAEYETAAVIAMTEEEAEDMYERLHEADPSVNHLDRSSRYFKKGITVTTWYLAKGLEFDAVFMLPGNPGSEFYDHFRYIAATRAMHELTVFQ